jgi:hypothetical protein
METAFKGSPLETEIRNSFSEHKLKEILRLTQMAANNNPNSNFWQSALTNIKSKIKC